MQLHRYRRRFGRLGYFREWMAGRALRRRVPDFVRERVMVSIIGDHVSDAIRAEQIYERDILEFVRGRVLDVSKAAGEVALDVGANIGNHSIFFSDIFQRVIAFEPNPLARSLLQINLEMNGIENVEVRPVGLSDRKGTATLEFEPTNLGAASSSELRDRGATVRRSTIELVIGDEVIDASNSVSLVKVDVEGAEEAVFRGLEQTLRRHTPVLMMEQWPEVIDATSGTSPSFSFLRELGYSAWEIQRAPLFRGQLGKIPTLLLGHVDYSLRPVSRLRKREYPALIFTPPDYEFPSHK
jgi:FkbM family methyltransferase